MNSSFANTLSIKAHAKINWTLDVISRRPDGYHEVASIMQPIELADILTIERFGTGISLEVTGPESGGVPVDDQNIVWRAADLLKVDGVSITIEKNIPNQAGLGGGSSDAAAAVIALNKLFNLQTESSRLFDLASKLGADVPFFLYNQTARVEGFGERVTPIPGTRSAELVVVKPPVGVSTREAYNELDRIQGRQSKNATASWPNTAASNDFEDVVYNLYPEVRLAAQALADAGAEGTLLCGSGAAVMGWGKNAEMIFLGVRRAGYQKVWRTRTIS